MNRIMSLCAALLMTFVSGGAIVSAQSGYEVKGVVVDAVGPVIGATVIEQGTTNGTSTGLDGDYVLTVSSADAVVEISCIGYASQTFVASQVPPTVTLSEDTQFLDEVVVIGYGTVKKEDMTGSIVAIKNEEINRGAVVNTQDMLKGKVAGLLVTPGDGGPGSGSRIRIRGAASLYASSDPLIVIDGVPLSADAGSGMSNPLDFVNPNDIESFTVLKDASSAAIYGSRASNGVIIITTKRGKGNRPQVNYNGSVSVQHNSKKIPVMGADEFRAYVAETFDPESTHGKFAATQIFENNTDWQSLVFRPAISHDHNLSVNGNVKDRMPYRASIGYQDQMGTLYGSNYERGTMDISLSPNFLDKHLTLDLSARGVYVHSDYAEGGVVGKAAFYNPTRDPYFRNEDGSIDFTTNNGYWGPGAGRGKGFTPNKLVGEGPLSLLYDKWSYANTARFVGKAAIDYKVHGFEALRFNVALSMDVSESKSANGVNPGSFQAYSDDEAIGVGKNHTGYNKNLNETLEAYANFNETWGKHTLDVVAGYSWVRNYYESHGESFINGKDEVFLKDGVDYNTAYPWNRGENYMVSFYGRINYSIASKYLFTASVRYDGSSRFAKDNRWGLFPSGAFAWNIKQEDWLKDTKAVSQLKLRLSAGQTGQQDGIANYSYMPIYYLSTNSYDRYNMGSAGLQYYYTPGSYDPDITWETTTTYNVGVDFGFCDDRITGNVDAYVRNTSDLLNEVITPMGANFGNKILTNIGSMQNKGIEFSLNVVPVQTKDWHLSIGFNGTFQDTKITKLNTSDDPRYMEQVVGISKGTGSMLSFHKVGYAPYTYYPYQQLYDSNGKPIQNAFVDRDGDGKITELDRYESGKSPIPGFYYGLNLKLSYKDWDFGINGHGNADYWIFNDFASSNSTSSFDVNAALLSNFATVVKRTGFTKPNAGEQYYSDLFLENASFFRLDDVNLGYTFRDVSDYNGTIRVAFSAQNLFVITKYTGIDPEVQGGNNGVDNVIWPRPRTYSIRVNFTF